MKKNNENVESPAVKKEVWTDERIISLQCVRSGVRTHALIRVPELKSGALDHSAILTVHIDPYLPK